MDFERLVVSSPGSSVVWIQYMAYQLSLTEVEGARAVAERALKAVSYRDEQEKLNIWYDTWLIGTCCESNCSLILVVHCRVAFLNLEHSYGDAASLSALFARALQHNDPKKIHVHMLSMYENRGKTEEALSLYQIATKKFPSSKKV